MVKKTSTATDAIWNKIPVTIRDEPNLEKAAKMIRQFVCFTADDRKEVPNPAIKA